MLLPQGSPLLSFIILIFLSLQFFHNTADGEMEFGPAFEREFLYQVFQMQVELTNLGQAEGAGLEKICFAPVTASGTSPTLSQCTIQSIFGYFQDSFQKFNNSRMQNGFEINYLNQIDKCSL
jgi:Niemann-Pick C1 protein